MRRPISLENEVTEKSGSGPESALETVTERQIVPRNNVPLVLFGLMLAEFLVRVHYVNLPTQ